MRPFSSSSTPIIRRLGWATTPAVQTTVLVGIRSPVESCTSFGGDALDLRAEADLDAAPAQLADRVVGELAGDLRQDAVGRLDEHEAHAREPGARVGRIASAAKSWSSAIASRPL